MAKKTNKRSRINYRPYPSLNPSCPPAFLRCKNSKCSEVFPNLEKKNDHERSCLANTPHHLTLCKLCTIKISGQQQLVRLFHALRCRLKDKEIQTTGGPVQPCTLPHCQTLKNVLYHLVEAQSRIKKKLFFKSQNNYE